MAAPDSGTRFFSSARASTGFVSWLALAAAILGTASMLFYHQALFIPRALAVQTAKGLGNGYSFGNDFYQVWLTAREWLRHGQDPYSPEMTREIQTGLYGRPLNPDRATDPVDKRRFPYPLFADLLFWPAAEFPFSRACVAIVCVLAGLAVATALLWLQVLHWRPAWKWVAVAVLLTMSAYPTLEGLYACQLGLLVAFLLPASVLALQRNRTFLAGVLMAIATIKPQVTALPILYLLLWSAHGWRTRGRLLIGLFSTLTLLVGASLLVSPHWIQSWIATLQAYHHYTRPPILTQVFASWLQPRISGVTTSVLTAVLIVAAMILAWRNRAADAASFAFLLTLALLLTITTIALLPGQAIYDHVILLPAVLLVVHSRHELIHAGLVPRVLLAVGALVLFWPWMAAFALIAMRPLLAPATFSSTAVLSLPLRSAASLPFAALALVAWTLRLTPATNPESA